MAARLLDAMDRQISYMHQVSGPLQIDFHLHDGCEIYLLLAGDVRYFVEGTMYALSPGDLVITNPVEIHKPTFTSDARYERIYLQFDARFVDSFSTASTDLLRCFYDRPKGVGNRLPHALVEAAGVLPLLRRYGELLRGESGEAGRAQRQLACLLELLTVLGGEYERAGQHPLSVAVHEKLSAALTWIDVHLAEDLSLGTLERELFIDRFYLSKLFKRHVGSTIHAYIIYKRIVLAKQLLAAGCSVAEARERSGFTDYTSFLQMFKRTVGVLPKDYAGRLRSLPGVGGGRE